MGNWFSAYKKEYKFVCSGFDRAGKTTLVYAFMKDCTIYGIPIMGYNMEYSKFLHKGRQIFIRAWDVYEGYKQLWRLGKDEEIDGVIWAINSSEENVKEVLHKFLQEPALAKLPLLIFANKQDLPNAATPAQITQLLDLESLTTSRNWNIFTTKGLESIAEVNRGFEWLIREVDEG